MSGHTPGPWDARGLQGQAAYVYTLPVFLGGPKMHGSAGAIAKLPASKFHDQHANARLIAAAPDLLDVAVRARRLLLQICDEASFPVPQTWVDAADAAIRKATGEDA